MKGTDKQVIPQKAIITRRHIPFDPDRVINGDDLQ